jgi:hypothetical protein
VRWTRVMVMVVAAVACAVGCGSQGPAPGSAPRLATAAAGGGPLQGGAVTGAGSSATASSSIGAGSAGAAGDGGAGDGGAGNGAASAGPGSASIGRTGAIRAPWPEREILPENNTLLNSNQVLDLATGVVYVLVPGSQESQWAPLALEAIDLRTGTVRRGESYPADGLALASGYLWVYGTSGPHGHPVLDEVDPGTLGTIRSVSMPGVGGAEVAGSDGVAAVAAGPAGSVWAGVGATLLRVSASTGDVLARAVIPAGLYLNDLALGPGGINLYAGAQLLRTGGGVVLEYAAGTGGLLARADGGPLTAAANGASVTPVPGGIWVSFRTGMMGGSGLLSARSFAVISGFPAVNTSSRGIGTVYGWTGGAPSVYDGGALWVATESGIVACVNPATGRVRVQEVVPATQAPAIYALAADRQADELVAVIGNSAGFSGVVTISPPRGCWG